jgi:predicted Zn-dependent protease
MAFDIDSLAARLRRIAPAADQCTLRVVDEQHDVTTVRQGVAEAPRRHLDRGAMLTVIEGDGIGYAATADLSDAGLRAAALRAQEWARRSRGRSVFDGRVPHLPRAEGRYATPTTQSLALDDTVDRIALLQAECAGAKQVGAERLVDWEANLWTVRSEQLLADADGAVAHQAFDYTIPSLQLTGFANGLTQTRSWGGRGNGLCQQGGRDVLERSGFAGSGARTAEELLQLLAAPNCPSGRFDLVLTPDQMMLQIHESIGHPLELDRILGDERNYAGTSFVTLDMFGSYQYGSPLLNVAYDPTRAEEFASFAFDDEGAAAARTYVIRDGVLLRPLGGGTSQARAQQLRADIEGVATTRACSWNRPPIDRMSNLNVEPGSSSFEEIVAATELGVLMQTNLSWSIDDSRNKFQFGCEWGRMIRNGQLAEVVRNPNYRGVSATFWRSLVMVGDAGTVQVSGTPYCGKGEPNQAIRVGHASPVCKFAGIDVFGATR